jgi:SAM-dependent methyltransferase
VADVTEAVALDDAKVEEFLGKALTDLAGSTTIALCSIGDRLGLFKDLAANGSATSAELAKRTNTNERYVREWLGAMVTAGYLTHDAGTYSLPPEHALVLAQEGGPMFFGGSYEMVADLPLILNQLADSFRNGGGVPQSAYPPSIWSGMERFTAGWFDNLMVQLFIPSVPELEAALNKGADVADIGCGSGRAIIRLAEAYPNCRFVGYDNFPGQLERAKKAVADAGLTDRIRLELADASKPIPDSFDIISTFDVVHDAADPLGLMKSIRNALRPGGFYICLDINCSDKLEENVGPLGTLFYGFSVLYCMTTALAQGGEGMGTLGLHEKRIRELAAEAGFSSVELAPVENPFNNFWVLRP